jgi:hypothetical protein
MLDDMDEEMLEKMVEVNGAEKGREMLEENGAEMVAEMMVRWNEWE